MVFWVSFTFPELNGYEVAFIEVRFFRLPQLPVFSVSGELAILALEFPGHLRPYLRGVRLSFTKIGVEFVKMFKGPCHDMFFKWKRKSKQTLSTTQRIAFQDTTCLVDVHTSLKRKERKK